MRTICIACKEWYFYNDGDEDCTKFVCSWCMGADPQKMHSKWSRLRFRILQRDGFTCKYCGDSPLKNNICKLHVDHVRAVSQFGTNAETNLITACAICNFGKLAFELNNGAKEKVNEYINGTDIGSGTGQESTSTWSDKVEDSQSGGSELADGLYVEQGNVQASTRENEIASKFVRRKKRK